MRGQSGSNPRQQWYDRNPLSLAKGYVGIDSPHVLTVRWTYTAPAARKAVVEMAECAAIRSVAATVPAAYSVVIRYTPSGGSLVQILTGFGYKNAIGEGFIVPIGAQFMMFPGDLLEGVTTDANADGALSLRCSAKITEFDA